MKNYYKSGPTHLNEMQREYFVKIAEEIMLEETMEKYYQDKEDNSE